MWQAAALAAAMTVMKRLQEKHSGVAQKTTIAQSEQAFGEMETGMMDAGTPSPTVHSIGGQSGMLGTFLKSYAAGAMTGGGAGVAQAGLSEAAAAQQGVMPGIGGLATTYAPASMVAGTQASTIAGGVSQAFGGEKLMAFMRAQGITGNMFANMIDSLLKNKKEASILDLFKSKGQ